MVLPVGAVAAAWSIVAAVLFWSISARAQPTSTGDELNVRGPIHDVAAEGGPYEALWDDRFTLHGVHGTVFAMATGVEEGHVYVGGRFTRADTVVVHRIALWDGAGWKALGDGVSEPNHAHVSSIAVAANGDVYVGGRFETAGESPAQNVARWDGTRWHSLGSGIKGNYVSALAIGPDGKVYAGGEISAAGGIPTKGVAVWDGTSWTALPGDPALERDGYMRQGIIRALAVDSSGVYAAGTFQRLGGTVVNSVARWDGETWHSLNGGMLLEDYCEHCSEPDTTAGRVSALILRAGHVYAGGRFFVAEPDSSDCVETHWGRECGVYNAAVWDGHRWSRLSGEFTGSVNAMSFAPDGRLYAGSGFSWREVGSGGVARLEDGRWVDAGASIGGDVNALVATVGGVFTGGLFRYAGDVSAQNVARLDRRSEEWQTLGSSAALGLNGFLTEMTVGEDGSIYVGGRFVGAKREHLRNVARWDGARWHGFGNAVDGSVRAIVADGDKLYVGGNVRVEIDDPAAFNRANGVARWDSTTKSWSALGEGPLNGVSDVWDLAAKDDKVYVGGGFQTAGGDAIPHLAEWDGFQWNRLAGGVDGDVYALALDEDGNLYAGGDFMQADTVSVSHIAMWDGARWHPLGSGTDGQVLAIAVDEHNIYVGGRFTQAGGVTVSGLARWHVVTRTWHTVLDEHACLDRTPSIHDLALNRHGQLYVAGYTCLEGGVIGTNLNDLDALRWYSLGHGSPGATAVATHEDDVYVGGRFITAGGKVSYNIARWAGATVLSVPTEEGPSDISLLQSYPNPFSTRTRIRYNLTHAAHVSLTVFDILGREVEVLVDEFAQAGIHESVFDGRALSNGVYLYRLKAGDMIRTGTMILSK